MAERRVLRMGDPDLLRVAEPVGTLGTPELESLVVDLWDTMAARGGIGLAATQIGVPLRVVVLGMEHSPRYPEAPPIPRTVLVNPVIEPLAQTTVDGWEGCLSVPGMRGLVPRWHHIRYRGVDPHGHPIDREVEGFHARVVQHECDHLDGILYPMRMRDLSRFGFEEELALAGRSATPG
ncbi:MAG: peptide deformylase [Ectothiorhodospiraceae bacterium]|nr:peptide deformylase [Chromatiales bacterium]MCP5157604.1 peptide deformylase [Ectothiorhodospiraceae bacterium]